MRITIAEISSKYPCLAQSMPQSFMQLRDKNYFIFGYEDSISGGGIEIKEDAIKVFSRIDLSIYKIPSSRIGYFQEPFETGNILFYLMLKYFAGKSSDSDNCSADINKLYRISSNYDAYENNKVFSPNYEGSFDVVDRVSFEKALLRFFEINKSLISPILSVFDSVENYCLKNKKKSFYGNYLSKIVLAVPSPDGGLIPEDFGNMRYMYVGQQSIHEEEEKEKIDEAKKLLRDKARTSYIFNKTGWFTNRFDGMWRRILSDEDAGYTPEVQKWFDFIADNNHQAFYKTNPELIAEMNINTRVDLKKYTDEHSVIMSDVIQHPLLYEAYPELRFIKIFLGIANDKKHVCHYNPEGNYLIIFSNPKLRSLFRIALHEIQHWIQEKENWGGGGNTYFSAMVSALGGKNFRSFMNLSQKGIDYFNGSGNCSFEKTKILCEDILKLPNISEPTKTNYKMIRLINEKDLYKNSRDVVNAISQSCSLEKNKNELLDVIQKNYGQEFADIVIRLGDLMKQGDLVGNELSSLGYTPNERELIYFKLYESISGELEARDTQNYPYRDAVVKKYPNVFLPLTTESYDAQKVEVLNFSDKVGGFYSAACEVTRDNKYILHLILGVKTEPIFHELGHILWDFYYEKNSNDNKYQLKKQEEEFVDEFIYFLSQNINDEKIKRELSLNRKKGDKYAVFFKSIFL